MTEIMAIIIFVVAIIGYFKVQVTDKNYVIISGICEIIIIIVPIAYILIKWF